MIEDKDGSQFREHLLSSDLTGGLSDTEKTEVESIILKASEEDLDPNLRKVDKDQDNLNREGVATDSTDIRTLIAKMRLPEKVKTALFGNSTCRTLLIRDGNKLIQHCVLKNPKLTEKEVEEFSRNPHLPDFVLRIIGDSRTWASNPVIRRNLVMNPKTPPAISLRLIRSLQVNDLKMIARSKGLPTVIVTTARKLMLSKH